MYWIVEYDINWLPICEICGKSFKKLMTHVFWAHRMLAKKYKIKYWLDVRKWIMCKKSIELARKNLKDNYDLCVKENLIKRWANSRFKNWHKGKRYFSEQSRIRAIKQMKDYNNNKK